MLDGDSRAAKSEGADLRPLYTQVRDLIKERISAGTWKPGALIPSEFQLAEEFGVSQGTVRKALIELERKNLLVRQQGRGTYVSEHSNQRSIFHFFHVVNADNVKELPVSIVRDQRTKRASREEQELLQLAPSTSVRVIRRVRRLGDKPVIYEKIILPAAMYKFLSISRGKETVEELYSIYQRDYGITIAKADEWLSAVPADAEDVENLEITAGTPLLQIVRVAMDIKGMPVELRVSRLNSEEYRYFSRIE